MPSSITPTTPPGIPGTFPWQYDVSTIATCDGPFPSKLNSVGVIEQLKNCGALDVHPSATVPGVELDTVNPTTMFPPGVVSTVVEYPGPVENVNVEVLNVATTDSAAVIVTVHVLVPVHAPLQPANAEPDAGAAVRITTCPLT
jgi:hypothetical protein